MPLRYPETDIPTVVFEGRCIVEEVDALYSWLREAITPVADLGGCTEVQTALLQLLLAMNVPMAVPPTDPVLAACLGAALPSAAPAAILAATPGFCPDKDDDAATQPEAQVLQ